MKKLLLSPKALSLLLAGQLLLSSASAQPARAVAYTETASFVQNAQVKAVLSRGRAPVFAVRLLNQEGTRFSVTVKDHHGTTLFQEVYSDRLFDRAFIFEDLAPEGRLTFTFRSLKDGVAQTFEVSSQTRTVQEVVVNKVK